MRKIYAFSLSALIVAANLGCTNFLGAEGDYGFGEGSATPYADEATLRAFSEMDGSVDWRLARFFALVEMLDFAATNSWQNAQLSRYPLIIYGAETGTPRYLEFRVIKDGTEIGSIACVAQKQEGEPVQYVMDFARELESSSARAIKDRRGRLIDSGYPARLLMRSLGSARSLDAVSGAVDETEYPVDVKLRELLDGADAATLEQGGITSPALYEALVLDQSREEERIAGLWKAIDGASTEILALSDEELMAAFSIVEASARGMSLPSSADFLLSDWYAKRTWFNPGGDCGANVISFITLGLGTASGYAEVPLRNSGIEIRAMLKAFSDQIGPGPNLFPTLRRGLEALTDYTIETDFFHSWATIDSDMKASGLPAISLRSSAWRKSWSWHYRTIIGTRESFTTLRRSFLWWSWERTGRTRWYFMHDNGFDGSNWWEKAGQYYHFQSAHVERE